MSQLVSSNEQSFIKKTKSVFVLDELISDWTLLNRCYIDVLYEIVSITFFSVNLV